jgi:uncharacterized protein YjiS (DUF1127 family)
MARLPRLHNLSAMNLIRRVLAWSRRLTVERHLSELDAHTLRDIGLEAWRGPLGARVETLRRERVRWSTSFVGLC